MAQEELAVLKASVQVLRIFQLWPWKKMSNNKTFYYFKYFITLTSCSPVWIATMLHVIVVFDRNLDVDLSEDLSMLTASFGIHVILLSFVLHQDKVALLCRHLSDFDSFGKPDKFDEKNQRLDLYSRLYTCYCVGGTAIYAMLGFVKGPKCRKINKEKNLNEVCGLFVPAWLPSQMHGSPTKNLFFVFQCYAITMLIIGAATISFTSFEIAQHIVLRINHLNKLLKESFDDPNDKVKRRRLINCVKYHNFIVKMHQLYNTCYKNCNGCYVLMTGVIFGCILNQFMREIDLGAAVHLGGWLISLFVRCHAGQSILSQSLLIPSTVAEINWYEAPVSLQRDLLMLLGKTQRPFYVYANPFGIMSFELFVDLLKTSMSYFTLLSELT